MSGKLFDKYGAICAEDVSVLEGCLDLLLQGASPAFGSLRVLEIGMHDGGTARGIERYLDEREARLEYWGIDPDDGTTRPRHLPRGGTAVVGDSARVFDRIPDGLDLVWVDGCHCFNHVVLDTLHYAPKVRRGGFMLFHDVNPRGIGIHHQPCGGPDVPKFGLATDWAHEAIRFPWPGWVKFAEAVPPEGEISDLGTRAFRRTS